MGNVWLPVTVVSVLALSAGAMAMAGGIWTPEFEAFRTHDPPVVAAPPTIKPPIAAKPWCAPGNMVGGFCVIN